jgi:arsenite methyltransferase
MNMMDNRQLRASVQRAYSLAAEKPRDKHPFPVGRKLAESLGYPRDLLAGLPNVSLDAFSGVSNVSVFAQIPAGAVVLDVGCGSGTDSLIAAQRTGPKGRVIGVDFSHSMLTRARQAIFKLRISNVEFYEVGAENLPVEDETVDVVLANGIFNLNPARDAIFRELARVVKPGGAVYAAELILREPLPPEIRDSESDWFA